MKPFITLHIILLFIYFLTLYRIHISLFLVQINYNYTVMYRKPISFNPTIMSLSLFFRICRNIPKQGSTTPIKIKKSQSSMPINKFPLQLHA